MLLLVLVLAVDGLLRAVPVPRVVLGLLDEPAHLATTALLLTAWTALRARPLPRAVVVGALAASVVIDLDHVPQDLLGSSVLTDGTPRPYSHSLTTAGALGAAAWAVRARPAAGYLTGGALGVLLHLWRDLATGQVSLLWPLTPAAAAVPYLLYAGSLAVAATVGRRGGRRGGSLLSRAVPDAAEPPPGGPGRGLQR